MNYNAPPSEVFAARGAQVWTVDVTVNARAIYVAVAGDVIVQMWNDPVATLVTFAGVPAGTILPIAVRRVQTAPAGSVILK